MAHTKDDYLNALRVVKEYVEQIEKAEVSLKDLSLGTKVLIFGSGLDYFVQEIDGAQILLSTKESIDDPKYDDFWIHYSEINKVL
jgi:hypothetical protein